MVTKRYGFFTDGKVQEDKEVYPGQYDPVDLSEVEFSFELGQAAESCVLHFKGGERMSIITDLSDDNTNTEASNFLNSLMPKVIRITGGRIEWPIRGNIVVVQTGAQNEAH